MKNLHASTMFSRPVLRLMTVGGLAAAVAFAASPASALDIIANYDSSISGNAAAVATIGQAVNMFNSLYSGNEVIHITFGDGSSQGILGESITPYVTASTASVLGALGTHSSGDAIDTAAVASSAGFNAGETIRMTTANARQLGFSNSETLDGTILLGTNICFNGHTTAVAGEYDLFGVACHEIDEVLGTSSNVGNGTIRDISDLWRYDGAGGRSFTTDTSQHAYFSVDGTHTIEEYNAFGRSNGDWGDWAVHNPAQVQDWEGTPGVLDNYGAGETDLLDADGYNLTPNGTPEPALMGLMWLGAIPLVRNRIKKARAK